MWLLVTSTIIQDLRNANMQSSDQNDYGSRSTAVHLLTITTYDTSQQLSVDAMLLFIQSQMGFLKAR